MKETFSGLAFALTMIEIGAIFVAPMQAIVSIGFAAVTCGLLAVAGSIKQ